MRKSSKVLILLVLIFIIADYIIEDAEIPTMSMVSHSPPVAVLMYHKVSPLRSVGGRGLRVTPQEFAWQMKYLKDQGFTTITGEDLIRYLKQKRRLPSRAVMITFDDGYEDNYLYAYPIMKKYGIKATIFIVADEMGRYNAWDVILNKQPFNPLLNWDEASEMSHHGIEFGSHTLTHPHLAKIDLKQAKREIFDSKAEIEHQLGVEVTTFAYPYGNYDKNVVDLIKQAGYGCAFTTRTGPVLRQSDPYLLKRFRVNGYTTKTSFATLVKGLEN